MSIKELFSRHPQSVLLSPRPENSYSPWSKIFSGMGEGRTSNGRDIMQQHRDARTPATVGPTTAETPAIALALAIA
jgi:hypothetical protein